MEKDFSFDQERYKRFEGTLPPPRTPEETFKLKSGIDIYAAIFAKEALNRIDPSYQAQIVVLLIRRGANHYVCSFKKEEEFSLWIMEHLIERLLGFMVHSTLLKNIKYSSRRIIPRSKAFRPLLMDLNGNETGG